MKQNKEPAILQERAEYEEALKNIKSASVRIELRRNGIDPYELSPKDFDEVRRMYLRMEQADVKANSQITAIQQEATQEKTNIGQEIGEFIKKVYFEQHPMPPPPELHLEEKQPEAGQEAPQADKEVQGG